MSFPSSLNERTMASRGTLGITVGLLRRFLPGNTSPFVVGLVCTLFASLVSLLQPWPLKLVLDCVVGNTPAPAFLASLQGWFGQAATGQTGRIQLLVLLCVGLLLIEVLMGAMHVASAYLLNSVALRLVFKLRCALFDHVQRLSLGFHDSRPVGDSLYRITWDSYCIQSIFSEGLVPALTAMTTLVGIGAVMLSRDWRLTAAAAVVALPLIVLVRRLDQPMTAQSTRVHEHESDVSTRVQETLSGIRAVQAFGREQFESERFQNKAKASLSANLRLTVLQTASQSVIGLVLAIGTAGVIWFGAKGVLSGRITPGDLVVLVAYIAMIFKPLETLAYTAGAIQSAAAGARRVFTLLDTAPGVAEASDAQDLPSPVRGEISIEEVSFAYDSRSPVLRELSLHLPAGSSLALVGPSGTGKTTLASLLLRFYDPDHGQIKLDGQDLRKLTLKSLRAHVALVTQEPILFAASIRENIAYGRPGADQAAIEMAARSAGAHDFIQRLPERYETQIGERGVTLSSGQRQRLAIARAFLKDAPVLVLDEPTSALDVETEDALIHALEKLMKNRTTLIIAHRLSTIRCADRIVVLQGGRIAETGTHEELLARGEIYARLHQLQFGDPDAIPAPVEART